METAVRKCPGCGQFVSALSPFCPLCGAFPEDRRNAPRRIWAGVLVVALGAIGWALSRYGVLGVPALGGVPAGLAEQGAGGGSSLQAFGAQDLGGLGLSGEGASEVLPQVGEKAGGVLGTPGINPPEGVGVPGMRMPDDIRRWLEHLKRVDLMREGANTQLTGEFTALVTALMPGIFSDPGEAEASDQQRRSEALKAFRRVDNTFREIQKEFHSLPPPPVCKPIAEEYSSALENTRAMVLDLMEAVADLDMGKALSLQNQSYARIDTRVATCNALIEALCARYREPNRYQLFVDKPSSTAVPSVQILESYKKMLERLLGDGE
jgi:hypothetical protein